MEGARLKEPFHSIIKLTRYQEYIIAVIITTFLGAYFAQGTFGWRLVCALIANWLTICFAAMINDAEDAEDDAANPSKAVRNPVSSGRLSAQFVYLLAFIVALLALVLFALLGRLPFIVGSISLLLNFLYSWKLIRLKAVPFIDMICHGLMLAGLQLLLGFSVFETLASFRWIWPFICVTSISMYGELHNELRDFKYDRQVGLKHTAGLLGQKKAQMLMLLFLVFGVGAALVSVVLIRPFHLWIFLTFIGLALFLSARSVPKMQRSRQSVVQLQKYFHNPIETAAAISLSLQLIFG